MTRHQRLAEFVVDIGMAEAKDVEKYVQSSNGSGLHFAEMMIKQGQMDEDDLAQNIASSTGYPLVSLRHLRIPSYIAKIYPAEVSRKKRFIPVSIKREGEEEVLYVAFFDPTDEEIIGKIEAKTGKRVKPVVASLTQVLEAIERYIWRWKRKSSSSLKITLGDTPNGKEAPRVSSSSGPQPVDETEEYDGESTEILMPELIEEEPEEVQAEAEEDVEVEAAPSFDEDFDETDIMIGTDKISNELLKEAETLFNHPIEEDEQKSDFEFAIEHIDLTTETTKKVPIPGTSAPKYEDLEKPLPGAHATPPRTTVEMTALQSDEAEVEATEAFVANDEIDAEDTIPEGGEDFVFDLEEVERMVSATSKTPIGDDTETEELETTEENLDNEEATTVDLAAIEEVEVNEEEATTIDLPSIEEVDIEEAAEAAPAERESVTIDLPSIEEVDEEEVAEAAPAERESITIDLPSIEDVDEEEVAEAAPAERESVTIDLPSIEKVDEEEAAEAAPAERESETIDLPSIEEVDVEEAAEAAPAERESVTIDLPSIEDVDEEEVAEAAPAERESITIDLPSIEDVDEEEVAEAAPAERESVTIDLPSIEEVDEEEVAEAVSAENAEPPELPPSGDDAVLEDIDGIFDQVEAEPLPGELMSEEPETFETTNVLASSDEPPPPPAPHSEEDLVDEALAVAETPPKVLEEYFDSEGEMLEYDLEGSMESTEYEVPANAEASEIPHHTSEMIQLDADPIEAAPLESSAEQTPISESENDWLGSSDAEDEDREIDPDLPDADEDEKWLMEAEKELNEGLIDDDLEETFASTRVETKDMALDLPDFDSQPSDISMDIMQSDPGSMETLLKMVHRLEHKVEMPPEEFIFDLVHGTLPPPPTPDDAALHEEVSSTMRTMIENNQIVRQELLKEFFKQR